jgi:lysophospholipase L1-like esterase
MTTKRAERPDAAVPGPWTPIALLAALALLAACVAPEAEPDPDPVEEPTPSVSQTWVPEDYQPEAPQRILFLGDSITAWGGSLAYRPLLLHNADDTWPEYVDHDLEWLYPDLTQVVNVASGGSTTSVLLESQVPAIEQALGGPVQGETMTVLTIGGNDMQLALASVLADQQELAQQRVDGMLDNIETLLDYLLDEDRFPDGNWVHLSNVYDPSDGQGLTADCFSGLELGAVLPLLVDANAGVRAIAEERGVAMIDLRYHFDGHGYGARPDGSFPGPDDPEVWFRDDCIHPNNRGFHEVRRLFYGVIEGAPLD